MANGWSAIRVDHALVLFDAEGNRLPADEPLQVRPGERNRLDLWVGFHNYTQDRRRAVVRLVGLGAPLYASASADVPGRSHADDPVRRRMAFDLPERLPPGKRPVALEWVGSDRRTLAVGEVEILVDDIAHVRAELRPASVSGTLGARTTIDLVNTSDEQVTLWLDSYVPDDDDRGKERLYVEVSPNPVVLRPGQHCSALAAIHRRVRWIGRPLDHVFDLIATGSSGTRTMTGTFTQKSILRPGLLKAIAAIVVLAAFALGLIGLTRWLVDDQGDPSTWDALPDAPDALIARSKHTMTWVDFERPDRNGLGGELRDAWDWVLGRSPNEHAVIVWGGVDEHDDKLATGAMYSATNDRWTEIDPLDAGEARFGHRALWTGEQLVVWGGYTPSQTAGATAAERLEETPYYGAAYDPVLATWDPLPESGLAPRIGHSMIWTGRELIVFGGVTPDGELLGDGGILRAREVDDRGAPITEHPGDLRNGTWSTFRIGDLGTFENAPRAFHAAAFDGRYMTVSGGIGPLNDRALLNDSYAYDVAFNRWFLVQNPNLQRLACHQAVEQDGAIVQIGGLGAADIDGADTPLTHAQTNPTGVNPAFCDRLRSIDRPDPTAWQLELAAEEGDPSAPEYTWTVLDDAPGPLGANFVAASTNQGIAIALSVDSLDAVAPVVYLPGDGASVPAQPSSQQPSHRSHLVAAWDGDAQLVVWGGLGACSEAGPIATRTLGEADGCARVDGSRFDAGP